MRILFFSLHAYVTDHSVPEAIVAEALKERGNDVIAVNCDGALSGMCISMSAIGVSPQASAAEKEHVCAACKRRRNVIGKEFGFNSRLLEEYVHPDDQLRVQEIMANVSPETYTDLVVMGVPVGRYALYEFMLNNKLNSWSLNDAEWEEYKIYLRNALTVAFAGKRILDDTAPDAVVAYNALYSVNHVFCALAERRDIPYYTLHAGSHLKRRLQTMTVFKGHVAGELTTRTAAWRELSQRPLSVRQVEVVSEHLEELLRATSPWVYSLASKRSSSASLRQFFGIDGDHRVLLATMSSADERFAAAAVDADVSQGLPLPMFPTLVLWIRALVEYVSNRNDLFLIIRVHPREFPNKREGVLSKQAVELQHLLVGLPDNVRVNWPRDGISLHDLVKITDVGLNAHSSAGLELSMFGAPVVAYDPNLLRYPPENNYVASDPVDYFEKIRAALEDGWSLENSRRTFRWLSFRFEHVAINIRDGFGGLYKATALDRPWQIWQLRRRAVPVKNSELLSIAIERNLESHLEFVRPTGGVQSTEEEARAIGAEVRKLFQMVAAEDGSDEEWFGRMEQVLSGSGPR